MSETPFDPSPPLPILPPPTPFSFFANSSISQVLNSYANPGALVAMEQVVVSLFGENSEIIKETAQVFPTWTERSQDVTWCIVKELTNQLPCLRSARRAFDDLVRETTVADLPELMEVLAERQGMANTFERALLERAFNMANNRIDANVAMYVCNRKNEILKEFTPEHPLTQMPE